MKTELLLSLAFVLSALVSTDNIAWGDEIDDLATNSAQNYLKVHLSSPWTRTKVYLYRTKDRPVELDGKKEIATIQEFLYTRDSEVLAFVDPDTGTAWAGSIPVELQPLSFFLETDSGIFRGVVRFGEVREGAIRQDDHDVKNGVMAYGQVGWYGSLVPTVKHGARADAVIDLLNKHHDLESIVAKVPRDKISFIQNSLYRVDNGLDPWLFVDEEKNGYGSHTLVPTTVTGIDVRGSELKLDLKNPNGSHTAGVWIDLTTWKVVKAIQDGKP